MSKGTAYKLLPPDGGYGYFIVFAVVINLTSFGSYTNYYGILFKDYFVELNLSSTDVTTLNGIGGIFAAMAGFLTAPLLKVLSKRQIAWLAAILYNCGMICSAFVKTKTIFFIFQGLIQSVGCGLLFNISMTVINDYFVEKRFLAMSLAQTLSAAACLLAPQFYQWSQSVYGPRSTVLWASALSIHLLVSAALFQPVKKHMRKVEITAKENEIKLLLQETELSLLSKNKVSNNILDDKESGVDDTKINIMAKDKHSPVIENADRIEIPHEVLRLMNKTIMQLVATVSLYGTASNLQYISITSNLLTVTNTYSTKAFSQSTFLLAIAITNFIHRSMLKSFVDLDLVSSFVFSIQCLGPTLCMASELTFCLMLPQALQSYGWSEPDVAWAFSFLSIGDILMRTALIILSKWLNKLGSRGVYIIGIIIAFFTRIGILTAKNKTLILSFLTLMGISRCIILVVVIMVISEAVPPEKYTAAIGYYMLTSGIANLTLGPMLGFVRDYTGSYTLTFYIITGVFGLVGMIWMLLSLCRRKKVYEEEPLKIINE